MPDRHPVKIESLAERLIRELDEIEVELSGFLDLYKEGWTPWAKDPGGDQYWDKSGKAGIVSHKVARHLGSWSEPLLFTLFPCHEPTSNVFIDSLDRLFKWAHAHHKRPPTHQEAVGEVGALVEALRKEITARLPDDRPLIVVPDTNAMLRNPDIASFSSLLGTDAYLVVLTLTMMKEIDKHKTLGKPSLKAKARAVNSRIKGWRNHKGMITRGVKVRGDTYVRAEFSNPEFGPPTPKWLDPHDPDDRILASALHLQRQEISSGVVVFTGDNPMLVKAEAIGLAAIDTTKLPAAEVCPECGNPWDGATTKGSGDQTTRIKLPTATP